jgi:hypothetical protein
LAAARFRLDLENILEERFMVALAATWKGRQSEILWFVGYTGEEHDQYYGDASFDHLGIDRLGYEKTFPRQGLCH